MDGDTTVEKISKDEFEFRTNEEWHEEKTKFFNIMPEETDTNYWGDVYLAIEGKIVKPRRKKAKL